MLVLNADTGASMIQNGTVTSAKIVDGTIAYADMVGTDIPMVGVGQAWQDVTASRALNVTYTNSTGKPILVAITGLGGDSGVNILCNGVKVGYLNTSAYTSSAYFIVPPGGSYIWNSSGGTKASWAELR